MATKIVFPEPPIPRQKPAVTTRYKTFTTQIRGYVPDVSHTDPEPVWFISNAHAVRDNTHAHSGNWALKLYGVDDGTTGTYGGTTGLTGVSDCSATSQWVPCPAGTSVGSSAWVYPDTNVSARISLLWFNGTGGLLSVSSHSYVNLTSSSWQQITESATAPSGTSYVAMEIDLTGAVNVWIDDVVLGAAVGTDSNFPPVKHLAIQDGIPVPYVRDSQEWSETTEYNTGDTVLYNGQPHAALRQSTGMFPPINNVATKHWAPLGKDRRIRLCVSAFMSQQLSIGTDYTVEVIPFVEWFDDKGNWIARVFSRTATNDGTLGKPNNLAFDSFTTPSVVITSGSTSFVPPTSWVANYYANNTLSGGPVLTQTVTTAGGSWGGGSPGSGVPASGWSASWVGTFFVPVTGTYTFTLTGAGGGDRLLVNGTTVVNNWTMGSSGAVSGTINLTGGSTATVEIDYWVPAASTNLIPNTFTASTNTNNTVPSNWTSPQFAVTAGTQYGGSIFLSNTSPYTLYSVTVNWLNGGGSTIGTTAIESGSGQLSGSTVIFAEATAPVGAVHATLTVHMQNTRTVFTTFSFNSVVYENVSANEITGFSPSNSIGANVYSSAIVPVAGNGTVYGGQTGSGTVSGSLVWYNGSTVIASTAVTSGAGALTWATIAPGSANGVQIQYTLSGSSSVSGVFLQYLPTGTGVATSLTFGSISHPALGSISSFSTLTLDKRTDDTGLYTWSSKLSDFTVGGFHGGTAWPQTPNTAALSVITGVANTMLGLTFRSTASAGKDQGLIFRYSSSTNYWVATRTQLKKVVSGTTTVVATHSTAFSNNDRMNAVLNGSAITIYRNGVSVATATDSFNSTATNHGMISG